MIDVSPDEFPGRGDLPDALAFVKPNRARAYIALERADGPVTATELKDALGCSNATAYRCLNDLQEIDLVCESIRLGGEYSPKTAYTTVADAPSWDRARADGPTPAESDR
ncbi:helix-turn-helix domain-containing protein [Natrinema pallidum]|uniref:HTH iclR-type domain-containing protein n=1 Tax=Natrinema pallidum DSM 3751 TaxID=1227495 RepID=L9YJW8_9EURY|nr:helix-turn-helix domain-containing protein [Natrinema pallidum]ELY73228.1 hypothetical protein C487_17540 [Natrinema pallidum DSM 3751]